MTSTLRVSSSIDTVIHKSPGFSTTRATGPGSSYWAILSTQPLQTQRVNVLDWPRGRAWFEDVQGTALAGI